MSFEKFDISKHMPGISGGDQIKMQFLSTVVFKKKHKAHSWRNYFFDFIEKKKNFK